MGNKKWKMENCDSMRIVKKGIVKSIQHTYLVFISNLINKRTYYITLFVDVLYNLAILTASEEKWKKKKKKFMKKMKKNEEEEIQIKHKLNPIWLLLMFYSE